jgi:hypothetical protein
MNVKPANETKPPKWMFKYVVNPLMKGMLRGPAKNKLGNVLMLLTFKGRKSGKLYTTPIGYRQTGKDTIEVFTDSPWWVNLKGGAPVTMLIKGKKVKGFAEPVDDKEALVRSTREFLEKNGVESAMHVGLRLKDKRMPSEDELRVILRDRVLIPIKIVEGGEQILGVGD